MGLQTPSPTLPVPSGSHELPDELTDLAPSVDVFPWPTWLVVAVAIGAFLLLVLLIVGTVWLVRRNRQGPPPLPARTIALRELEALRRESLELDPYAFSVRVSDVLRSFIGGEYNLRAPQQTSPEFLAAIAHHSSFAEEDRQLLGRFLEKCDLLKFAHIDAGQEDSAALLASAAAFIQGGRV